MARRKHTLTALAVRNMKEPGRHPDGGGLYLEVARAKDGSPRKNWVVRFRAPNGKIREMGIGTTDLVDLAKARQRAEAARKLADDGIDPIEDRKAERKRLAAVADNVVTFREAAKRFIDTNRASWKNAKHADQWLSTLETYAFPVFGDRPVDAVDVGLVLKVVEPLWLVKTETASRLRGRIERILDWAKTRELRAGDNPARWRGHLDNILPARNKTQKVQHFPALPYKQMPAFYAELEQRRGTGAAALRFAILTAARTGEVVDTRWREVDLEKAIWTIPAERMKSGREHRVPLSLAVLNLLKRIKLDRDGDDWVFRGQKQGDGLARMSLSAVLKVMKRRDITVHGTCRSTFRDWVAEQTDFPGEVAEAALAHVIGDATERAYRRGDLFEKRRALMDAWASYVTSAPAAVLSQEISAPA